MKVLAVLGSARKGGNTDTLLQALLEPLSETSDTEVVIYALHELDIKPCRGCDTCRKMKDGFCVIKDDMQRLYPEFIAADLVVMASPIYWWSVSAQIKLFIDRLYGLDPETNTGFFRGKKVAVILTYYGEDPNSGADLAVQMFKEIAAGTGLDIVSFLRYSSGKMHVQNSPQKLAEARELGLKLAANN
jgi:multimeric flavodoxin WrbA